jgi:hypothetical protein
MLAGRVEGPTGASFSMMSGLPAPRGRESSKSTPKQILIDSSGGFCFHEIRADQHRVFNFVFGFPQIAARTCSFPTLSTSRSKFGQLFSISGSYRVASVLGFAELVRLSSG